MKVVILAGGPGTRLWPLSHPGSSKAFQPVIRGESMLQYTYRQLSRAVDRQDIYIQAPRSLKRAIQEQIPNLDAQHVILNPIPKDTLPITLWVMSVLGSNPEEPILFRCVDQFIADEGVETFLSSLEKCIQRYNHKKPTLTLLCSKYDSFDPGYGYAVADSSKNIVEFVEKPAQEAIRELAKKGTVYRNPQMIIMSKSALLHALEKLDYPWSIKSKELLMATGQNRERLFLEMEYLSISDTLFQTSRELKMDIIDYDFLDVGTYKALYELNKKDSQGNVAIGSVITGKDCRNNFIANQNNEPLVVEALHDSVVVQTTAGSLVISMKSADSIKELHKKHLS